jgi:L-aminopeptidase/D-esterase-like protein
MRTISSILFLAIVSVLAACAAHREPIIDMQGVDEEQFVEDWNECAAYSKEVNVAKGAAKGAGVGAAVGAVAGAIGGNSRDVREGAGFGALYGGTRSGLEADRESQKVFKRCMRGRGYRVLN